MNIFVIHRFEDRQKAKKYLNQIAVSNRMHIKWVFLDTVKNRWEIRAKKEINNSEVIVVFNNKKCHESSNCEKEIKYAEELGKEILIFDETEKNDDSVEHLRENYDFTNEFKECFLGEDTNSFELYKLMLKTSEDLILRRQQTNSFFITVLGTIIAIAGVLVKIDMDNFFSSVVVFLLSFVSIILCISWYNLINNYGKLNRAKFKVINRIEKDFKIKIFTAEWIALGKGLRKEKYQSFTNTEKHLPLYFIGVIIFATLIYLLYLLDILHLRYVKIVLDLLKEMLNKLLVFKNYC